MAHLIALGTVCPTPGLAHHQAHPGQLPADLLAKSMWAGDAPPIHGCSSAAGSWAVCAPKHTVCHTELEGTHNFNTQHIKTKDIFVF